MINRLSLQGTGTVVFATLAAMTLVLGGCITSQQIGGIGGEGGSAAQTTVVGSGGQSPMTTTTTTVGAGGQSPATTGGAGGEQSYYSVALFDSQITQVPAGAKFDWLSAGEKLDPTTLIVVVSSETQSCNTVVFDFGSKSHRQVLIGLPQAMQKVGKYDLSSPDVIGFGSFWLTDGMGNGGGGKYPITVGTVEVLSIDAATIEVRLEGLPNDFALLENVDHQAPRCP